MASFPVIHAGSGLEIQPIRDAVPAPISSAIGHPNILLTTVRISDDHIWANGLYQNVYIIYKLLEMIGYRPWLMVENNGNNKDAKIHDAFRVIDFPEYIQNPFPVKTYIEMGMSCDPGIRKFFRNAGTKVCKLYLGNILNIDIETTTFLTGVNFSHHVAGEIDEIWVSPHYDIHAEYAGSINGLCGKTRIAPYVWDPHFIRDIAPYDGTGITKRTPRTFIVMEPNISFQKNSLIPILALEIYYRKYPDRVDQVLVINGQKLKDTPYFASSILPCLTIHTAGKLQMLPRANFINVVRVFRNAIVLQHQVNNEYNYSFMEWMYLGFPLIHNVPRFSSYGYYYPENDFDTAAAQIERVVTAHEANKESYTAHAKQIAWELGIYNPKNLEGWRTLVEH